MTKMLSSQSVTEMEMLKGMLEDSGIPCTVRNLYAAVDQGPARTDVWPELWVLHEADVERARAILDRRAAPSPAWACPDCGEESEGQFAACWNCGAARPTSQGAGDGAG